MEKQLLVFVSSVIAGLAGERSAARAAVEAIPLSRSWLFEFSSASSLPLVESYLSQVRKCDIFILLLKDKITDPVKTEVETARAAGKPRLVFLWEQAPDDVAAYARSLGVKYAGYRDPDHLAGQVAEAVTDELIRGYRQHQVPLSDLSGLADFMGKLAQGHLTIVSGGAAVIMGNVTVHPGGKFVGGNETTIAADTPPPELLQAYLTHVAAECGKLPLGIIDTEFVRTSGKEAAALPDIYVDLHVVAPAEEEEPARRGRKSGDGQRAWALRLARGEGSERTPLLEAISRPAGCAVLIGDAGSGKTTFVNYLAYLLATKSPALPETLRGLLPLRFVLREVVARHVPANAKQGTAQMIWDALDEDVRRCLGTASADKLLVHLHTQLLQEGGCFLFDGLDEVPAARTRRKVLLEAIQEFLGLFKPTPPRALVTARPYAYADPAWRLPRFTTLALSPFDEGQVKRFVARWYQAVRPAMGWNEETAAGKGDTLATALRERPYLGDLASRPLLLTLMATLHSSWGQLPDDRADLYEETVKLLLGRWQRAREVRRPDGDLEMEPGITQTLNVGEDRLRHALETLAYTVHDRQRTGPARDDAPADIGEGELLVACKPLLGSLDPDELLKYLRERAGLLVARDEGVYAFPHRSFQEYLAACHLANGPAFAVTLRGLVIDDPAWWREVCLLGIGKTKQGGLGQAVTVVNALIPESPAEVEEIGKQHWRLAALAGEALVELRLAEKAPEQETYKAILRRARRWLVRLLEEGHLPARERASAGDTLARLGDPRFDADFYFLPRRYRGQPEPHHGFVAVSAGPFVMGSKEGDKEAWSDEYGNPDRLEMPYAYWIARYPVTVAQFGVFLVEGGYEEERWWTPTGWAWRRGEWDSQVEDTNLRDWLKRRPRDLRGAPMWWSEQQAHGNRPVMGVSWFEGMAYSRWLDGRLRGRADWLPEGYGVRLPTEAEWEKAARAADGRRYPWGDEDWDEERANILQQIGRATSVGMYPRGATQGGLHDLSGNVWEWTLSLFEEYPYRPDDGRNDLNATGRRVVRGGSWYYYQRFARGAYRDWHVPDLFYDVLGLRLVVSLSVSDY